MSKRATPTSWGLSSGIPSRSPRWTPSPLAMNRDCLVAMVGRKKKMEDTQQVAFRLSMDLIQRADAYAAALTIEHPGMHYTRTDAVRVILAKHLPPLPSEADEPAQPGPASKPRKPRSRP